MDIIITNSSGKPIYEQITSQIKELIMNGTLKEGDALPSMRSLAQQLHISIITTKRAYEELEKEGFIYTVAAKGCFVAPKNTELLREESLKKIEEYISEIVSLANMCGIGYEELIEMLKFEMEE